MPSPHHEDIHTTPGVFTKFELHSLKLVVVLLLLLLLSMTMTMMIMMARVVVVENDNYVIQAFFSLNTLSIIFTSK